MLENQIDVKLVSFSKLGTNFGNESSAAPPNASDKAPLLDSSSSSSNKEVFKV